VAVKCLNIKPPRESILVVAVQIFEQKQPRIGLERHWLQDAIRLVAALDGANINAKQAIK
jgi:hypothetical protein